MKFHNCDQPWQHHRAGRFLVLIIMCVGVIAIGLLVWQIRYWFLTPHTVVTVSFNNQQCLLNDKFELKWIHSVEKQWWIESYIRQDDQLLLTDTYFQTFGAGTPSTGLIGKSDGKYPDYTHFTINTSLPYLNWMISSNIKAQIILNHNTNSFDSLPIYKWVDDYSNINIATRKLNLWNLQRQESCYEYTPPQ